MTAGHVVVDVSGHGYGHFAQTAPVVEALLDRVPGLRVTLRTEVPGSLVRGRLGERVDLVAQAVDVGMMMASATEVLAAESHAAYRRFHAGWEAAVDADARRLERLAPDVVLSNVSYRGLAAAARLGLPALAFSSLDWHGVYRCYCAALPGAGAIAAEIRDAYEGAHAFVALEPGMGRHGFANQRRAGPIGTRGRARPAALRAALGAGADQRLVLIALGGIPTRLDLGTWPRLEAARYLAPGALIGGRRDAHDTGSLLAPGGDFAFVDLLASCDAVVTKPGYGTYVDAACNGRPVVHTRRPDWPEEPHLGDWLARHVPVAAIEWDDLVHGRLGDALEAVLAAPAATRLRADGAGEVARMVVERLRGGA